MTHIRGLITPLLSTHEPPSSRKSDTHRAGYLYVEPFHGSAPELGCLLSLEVERFLG